jgi:surface polysaccharide O-acyltransferase-like enzyme
MDKKEQWMKQAPPVHAMDIYIIKAIAILGVLVIHTTSAGYRFPVLSFDWISSVFWGSVSRAAVPLFFMCSGALLLRPEKPLTLKKLYGWNMLRVLVVLLVWGMAYKIWSLAVSEGLSPAALLHAFKEVLLFKHVFHFYYLHITLLVYALLPITRLLVANASNRDWHYMLGAWFALGIAYPTLRHFWPVSLLTGFPLQWMLNMTYAAAGYGLLGYRLRQRPLSAKLGIGLTVVGFSLSWAAPRYSPQGTTSSMSSFLRGCPSGLPCWPPASSRSSQAPPNTAPAGSNGGHRACHKPRSASIWCTCSSSTCSRNLG